jgi:uncharacterized protein (TIGR02266 family)
MVKILLADDMVNFLDLEVSFLKRADCQILTAHDGVEALKLAKMEKPDIILLDVEMPRMTGIECCRIIKSDPATKNIPVIMVTATSKREESFKAHADDFFQKPITEDQFLKRIKKFVKIKDRETNRVNISLQVNYKFGEKADKIVQAFTKDVSNTGMFIITRDIVPIGSVIEVDFKLSNTAKPIIVKAEVIREMKDEQGGYFIGGMGLQFLNLSDKDQKALDAFIKANA